MYFTPTRDDALRRLKDFIPAAGITYAQGRNYDRGADAHKSVKLRLRMIRRINMIHDLLLTKQ